MLTSQEEQEDRRRTMQNDQRVREQTQRVFAQDQTLPRQATTMHQFAQADAQTPRGRFSAVETASVVGADPIPNYPAAAAHQRDPVPIEPSLGYRIDALEPSDPVEISSFTQQEPGPTPADAPSLTSLGEVQRTGVGSLSNKAFRRF